MQDENLMTRIINHLMLNACFMQDIGLYHGKMGITIFFAHYSRYTKEVAYNDFAEELLDEIYQEISIKTSIDFESGLCGIGWGIEYLLQNGFFEGDSNDILSELDAKVMERDIRRFSDTTLHTGLNGISCYINKRLSSSQSEANQIPFDDIYISEWKLINNSAYISDNDVFIDILNTLPYGDNILSWKLGLHNGCAGWGIKKIIG